MLVDGCWIWTGVIMNKGYGRISINGKWHRAHRVSFELFVGPIPAGMDIDHRCCNRACVNPEHLRPVTNKQNHENYKSARPDSRTGIRGVSLTKSGRYTARVKHHGIRYNLGTFDTAAEAEAVVISKRCELFTHNEMDRVR